MSSDNDDMITTANRSQKLLIPSLPILKTDRTVKF